MSAREYKLPFGKYKGETLEDVYLENRDYLDWLVDVTKFDERRVELRSKIQECIREMRRVRVY
jgi:uncharacterized protein (DUF3820 family)